MVRVQHRAFGGISGVGPYRIEGITDLEGKLVVQHPMRPTHTGDNMPPKKKTEEETIKDVTTAVADLLPIAEILKQETTIFGECSDGKLPRDAKFSARFLEMATRLVAAGLSEKDLAYVIGTNLTRIRYWKKHNPLFRRACEDGKEVAKVYLIAQGLKAAAGYNTLEKNIKIKRKVMTDGSVVEYAAEESHFHKHVKPDSSLLVFMLANLSRMTKDEIPWTSQHKIELENNKSVNIKISGRIASDQITKLAGNFMPEEFIEAEIVNEKINNTSEKSKRLPASDTKTHNK